MNIKKKKVPVFHRLSYDQVDADGAAPNRPTDGEYFLLITAPTPNFLCLLFLLSVKIFMHEQRLTPIEFLSRTRVKIEETPRVAVSH